MITHTIEMKLGGSGKEMKATQPKEFDNSRINSWFRYSFQKPLQIFFNGGNTTSNSAKQTIQFIFFTIKTSKVNSLFLLTEVKICFKIRNKKHNNKKSPVMILSDHVLHPPPRSSSPASVSQLIDRQSAFLPQLWTQCIVSLPQGGNFICGSCSSTYKYLEIATKPLSSSPLHPSNRQLRRRLNLESAA